MTGMARATEEHINLVNENTFRLLSQGLIATLPEEKPDTIGMTELIYLIKKEKFRLSPDCSTCKKACGKTDDFDLELLSSMPDDTVKLKWEIITLARELAIKTGDLPINEDTGSLLIKAMYYFGYTGLNDSDLAGFAKEIQERL